MKTAKRNNRIRSAPAILLLLIAAAGLVVGLRVSRRHGPPEAPAASAAPAAEATLPAPSAPAPSLPAPPEPSPAENEPEEEDLIWEASMELPLGPLCISEVRTAGGDFVELRNISDESVQLSGYYLSDKRKNLQKISLPERELEPGEFFVSEELSLSVQGDRVWLSDSEGRVLDFVLVGETPVGGSYGRPDGERGWAYFAAPTPGEANGEAYARIAERPVASVASGPYDGVESLTVELTAGGTIRYTTDGSAPTEESPVYTEPLVLERTTVLRAVNLEEGALPSRIATFNYFLNENHSLPIVCFCSDDLEGWTRFYRGKSRFGEFAGESALYEDGEQVFQLACGLRLKGFSAVLDPMKKNFGLYFRGRYGDGELTDCDLFGSGVTSFGSLLIRAGQDHHAAIIRNELMQELCLQASACVPTQHNKYCILYMNGKYMGIYSLKENMNEQFFADLYGVSPESVTTLRRVSDVKANPELWGLISFCEEADMSQPENYERFCQGFDIDNFIDYVLLEGFCGNTDLFQNVRYFRSDEMDGRWRFAFFDLDCCFYNTYCGMRVIFEGYAKKNFEVTGMTRSLLRSPEFRDKLLRRYAELIDGPLSPENVMREIDLLEAEIRPEVERDRTNFRIGMAYWEQMMKELRSFATEDYIRATLDTLCQDLNVTREERAAYFGER